MQLHKWHILNTKADVSTVQEMLCKENSNGLRDEEATCGWPLGDGVGSPSVVRTGSESQVRVAGSNLTQNK